MTPARARVDVLVFAEDPGAANYVADLPGALARKGYTTHFSTCGPATAYLEQRGLHVDPLPSQADPAAMLDGIAPRLIVVGTAENPDSPGLRLVASGAARRIPSLGVLDSSTNLQYRFRGRSAEPLEFCPNVVIVPDTVGRDGLVELGLRENRIVVAGHPHWDYVRAVRRTLHEVDRSELRKRYFRGAATDRTVVLFAAERSDGLEPGQFQRSDEYTLKGSGGCRGRTEIVIEEFLAAAAAMRDKLHLVLRLHPKQSPLDLADYQGRFDTVSRAEPSLEVIYAADAVVGMTSMLMIEAALLERPTLAILPRARESAWLSTIPAGVTPFAADRAAVRAQFISLLNDPRPPSAAALDRLFPPGALEHMVATCERFGLV
jgi:hypothetical protein